MKDLIYHPLQGAQTSTSEEDKGKVFLLLSDKCCGKNYGFYFSPHEARHIASALIEAVNHMEDDKGLNA